MITCAFDRHSSRENSCSAAPISCDSISSPAPGLAAMDIQTSVRAMTSACGPPSISLSSARRSVSARSAGGATDSSGTVDLETICTFYTSSMFSERRMCSSKIASSIPSMPESDFKKRRGRIFSAEALRPLLYYLIQPCRHKTSVPLPSLYSRNILHIHPDICRLSGDCPASIPGLIK